jgi:plastocyanin
LKRAGLLSVALVTSFVAAPSHQSQQSPQITVTGQVELSSNADSSNAVVWLNPVGEQSTIPVSARRQVAQLLQKDKSFSPHLVVVPVGAAVDFPNKDPFFHNVFSLFEGKRFDLGLYEAGSTRSVVFNRAGVSYIFCNIHPEMSAVVIALKTPYYGMSDNKGLITIPNVPAGTYDLEVWHERVLPENLDSVKRRTQISANSNSLGVIRLISQRSFSQMHKNKYGRDYDNPTPNAPVYIRP